MLATLEHNADRARPRRSRPPPATRAELPFEDESFDLVLGHAVLHHLPDLAAASPSSTACSSPAARCSSPASRRRTGDRLADVPKQRRAEGRAAVAPGAQGAPRPARGRRRARARAGGRRRRARLRPGRPRAPRRRRRASPTSACRARSCWRTGSAGSTARWRRAPSPRTSRGAGSSTPTAATSLLQRVDRALLEPRLPPRIFYNLMLAARKPE